MKKSSSARPVAVPQLLELRRDYHAALLKKGVLTTNNKGVPSNADKDSATSVAIAKSIAEQLKSETGVRLAGQSAGSEFEKLNAGFIKRAFSLFRAIRPGDWDVEKASGGRRLLIAQFEQFSHLVSLDNAARKDPELAAALGNEYTIRPDIVITRKLVSDSELNRSANVVDETVATRASLRASNKGKPLLHASISSKWTIRSDRSQNSRAEALNLIRNRKGHLPHIVVVTGEPLPSRLASIALGTGDIDCVYHFALGELIEAVKNSKSEEASNLLRIMVDGKRLKDISDLPLDLAV